MRKDPAAGDPRSFTLAALAAMPLVEPGPWPGPVTAAATVLATAGGVGVLTAVSRWWRYHRVRVRYRRVLLAEGSRTGPTWLRWRGTRLPGRIQM
ncbi:MAG: hypothetical protein WD009_11540 [Phycisphaeraceae bacterium]